jgi:hypothetical protein
MEKNKDSGLGTIRYKRNGDGKIFVCTETKNENDVAVCVLSSKDEILTEKQDDISLNFTKMTS